MARLGKSREIEGQTFLLLDFAFCFVHLAQALLNSTPQLLARDRRAVAQGAQLGPGDLRMDAAAQTAVGSGDDVLSADEFKRGDYTVEARFVFSRAYTCYENSKFSCRVDG